MADLIVRRVPSAVVKSLNRRAARHQRSLQQELMAILVSAVEAGEATPAEVAAVVRSRLSRAKRRFTDSVISIGQDRER